MGTWAGWGFASGPSGTPRATPRDGGTNFAVASGIADAIELSLFDEAGAERRVQLPEYSYGVWHGFVPGVGPGQA